MAAANVHLTICVWMVVTAAVLTPLTWFGTPKVGGDGTSPTRDFLSLVG